MRMLMLVKDHLKMKHKKLSVATKFKLEIKT